jgi:hypothetical protein
VRRRTEAKPVAFSIKMSNCPRRGEEAAKAAAAAAAAAAAYGNFTAGNRRDLALIVFRGLRSLNDMHSLAACIYTSFLSPGDRSECIGYISLSFLIFICFFAAALALNVAVEGSFAVEILLITRVEGPWMLSLSLSLSLFINRHCICRCSSFASTPDTL